MGEPPTAAFHLAFPLHEVEITHTLMGEPLVVTLRSILAPLVPLGSFEGLRVHYTLYGDWLRGMMR